MWASHGLECGPNASQNLLIFCPVLQGGELKTCTKATTWTQIWLYSICAHATLSSQELGVSMCILPKNMTPQEDELHKIMSEKHEGSERTCVVQWTSQHIPERAGLCELPIRRSAYRQEGFEVRAACNSSEPFVSNKFVFSKECASKVYISGMPNSMTRQPTCLHQNGNLVWVTTFTISTVSSGSS